MDESFKRFSEEGFEVLACLRPKLMEQQKSMPNTRILTGNFSKVSQVWGNLRGNCRYINFLLLLLEEEQVVIWLFGLHQVLIHREFLKFTV